MTRNAKRALSLIFAVIMLSMTLFSLPASAYGNGGASVYNSSGTKLGTGDIWTNNKSKTDTGKILYGELTSTSSRTLTVKAGYTTVEAGRINDANTTWAKNTKTSTAVSTSLEISDSLIPVDARGYFKIGSYISRVCKRYNYGSGVKECSDGVDDCVYLDGQ